MDETLTLRAENLEWRDVDGELIVLDLDGSEYMKVNGTGATVWRELDGGTTRGQLVQSLVEGFGVDQARAEADLDAFLGQLDEKGLIARTPG